MRKNKVLVLFSVLFLLAIATPIWAASVETGFEFNEKIVDAIVNLTILGIGLTAAIQALKEWLKIEDWKAIILSVLVSYGFTAAYLLMNNIFTWVALLAYGFLVTAEVNGFFKYAKLIVNALSGKKEES